MKRSSPDNVATILVEVNGDGKSGKKLKPETRYTFVELLPDSEDAGFRSCSFMAPTAEISEETLEDLRLVCNEGYDANGCCPDSARKKEWFQAKAAYNRLTGDIHRDEFIKMRKTVGSKEAEEMRYRKALEEKRSMYVECDDMKEIPPWRFARKMMEDVLIDKLFLFSHD